MLSTANLHFQLMTPEAQRAALQRLALRGWDVKTISEHTGVPESEVRIALGDTTLTAAKSWSRPSPRWGED